MLMLRVSHKQGKESVEEKGRGCHVPCEALRGGSQ